MIRQAQPLNGWRLRSVPEGVLPEWDTRWWAGVDSVWERENSKPEKCLKMAQNPSRPMHVLLGTAFYQPQNLILEGVKDNDNTKMRVTAGPFGIAL